jgi:hypothetical protein
VYNQAKILQNSTPKLTSKSRIFNTPAYKQLIRNLLADWLNYFEDLTDWLS